MFAHYLLLCIPFEIAGVSILLTVMEVPDRLLEFFSMSASTYWMVLGMK